MPRDCWRPRVRGLACPSRTPCAPAPRWRNSSTSVSRKFVDNSDPVARRKAMRILTFLATALLTLGTLSATAQKTATAQRSVPAPSLAPATTPPAAVPSATAPPAAAPTGATAAVPLTADDLNAWLDGYVPYALHTGDIAGAVVAVVKDGQIVTERGYGYSDVAKRTPVDPKLTLFRPGSVSKLFTWTAVMQLVEQGKIDLDADVNQYLDFKIPPYQGKPITMRNLMTHTPGFEDAFKGGIRFSGQVPPLGDVLKRMLPERVFAPGTTPAYSNYGAGLASYIVQRVSGIPFEEYVEHNIFAPLDMTHSSFRQPLPAQLAPFMAQGYPKASEEAKPYELISIPAAGSLAVSGTD